VIERDDPYRVGSGYSCELALNMETEIGLKIKEVKGDEAIREMRRLAFKEKLSTELGDEGCVAPKKKPKRIFPAKEKQVTSGA